jgi:hypothetical protein
VKVLDVGNGSAILVSKNRVVSILGCGGNYFAAGIIKDAVKQVNARHLNLLLLPAFEETEISAAPDVLELFSSDCLAVPAPDAQEDRETLSFFKENTPVQTENTVFDLAAYQISFYCKDGFSAALISDGDTRILISFLPGNDLSRLPERYQDAQMLICRAGMPAGYEDGAFPYVLISDEAERANENIARCNMSGKGAAATGGCGNLVVTSRGDGVFSVKQKQ